MEAHYKQQQKTMQNEELVKKFEEMVGVRNCNFKYVRPFVTYKFGRNEGEKIENLDKEALLKALEYFKSKHCLVSKEDAICRLKYSMLSSEDLEEIKSSLNDTIFEAMQREVQDEYRDIEREQDEINERRRRYEEKRRLVEDKVRQTEVLETR